MSVDSYLTPPFQSARNTTSMSSDESNIKMIQGELSDAMSLLTDISGRLGQHVNQRLTTKHHDELNASIAGVYTLLTSVQMTLLASEEDPNNSLESTILTAVQNRLAYRTRGSQSKESVSYVMDETRFSTITSGVDSSCDGLDSEKDHCTPHIDLIIHLRGENSRLHEEIKELELELQITRTQNEKLIDTSFSPQSVDSVRNLSHDFLQVSQELSRCIETLKAMKMDRKRLKSDACDIHLQMKQLYCTLGDKEAELRDFIRSYDQRKQDCQETVKQLRADRGRMDQENKELARRAHEAEEQNETLKAHLEERLAISNKLQQQLLRILPRQLFSPSHSTAMDSSFCQPARFSTSEESLAKMFSSAIGCSALEIRDGDVSILSSLEDADGPRYQEIYLVDNSPHVQRTASISEGQLQASREKAARMANMLRHKRNPSDANNVSRAPAYTNTVCQRKGSLFIDEQSRTIPESDSASPAPTGPSRFSFLTQDNIQEKMATLAEGRRTMVEQWRANHVLVWLELDMNMIAYGPACSDNVKSGKILLGLSDSELDSALRLVSPLHRKKMRLAIEELRDPSSVKYPVAAKIDHMWASHEWIYSLGLAQYSSAFEAQLVDGRLLGVLTKKDLDKHLGVHKKCHQTSIVYGIELLRHLNFDKHALQERRRQSKQNNCDPLVWSNQQIVQWAERIDLQEYAPNLRESGIHGAVLVLDAGFNADTFATVLGIPASKSYVRRHLAAELDAIMRPALSSVDTLHSTKRSGSSFVRSLSGTNQLHDDGGGIRLSGRKLSLRGSIGRAFGRKSTNETTSPKVLKEPPKSLSHSDLQKRLPISDA